MNTRRNRWKPCLFRHLNHQQQSTTHTRFNFHLEHTQKETETNEEAPVSLWSEQGQTKEPQFLCDLNRDKRRNPSFFVIWTEINEGAPVSLWSEQRQTKEPQFLCDLNTRADHRIAQRTRLTTRLAAGGVGKWRKVRGASLSLMEVCRVQAASSCVPQPWLSQTNYARISHCRHYQSVRGSNSLRFRPLSEWNVSNSHLKLEARKSSKLFEFCVCLCRWIWL